MFAQAVMVDGNLGQFAVMPHEAVCIATVHCGLFLYQSVRSCGMITCPMGRDVKLTPMTLHTPAPSWNGSFGCLMPYD